MPKDPWEPRVADAEIIPIGTRGRPGRGVGQAKPSSAARSLAGGSRPRPVAKTAAKPVAKSAGRPAAGKPRGVAARRTTPEPESIEQVTTEAVPARSRLASDR